MMDCRCRKEREVPPWLLCAWRCLEAGGWGDTRWRKILIRRVRGLEGEVKTVPGRRCPVCQGSMKLVAGIARLVHVIA